VTERFHAAATDAGPPPGPARSRGRLLIVGGLVLLIVVGVAAYFARPSPTVGAGAVAALASATPDPSSAAPSAAASSASPAPSRSSARPRSPAASKSPAGSGSPAGDAPVRLRIPALGLDASVAAVGVDAETGEFAVPPSVDRVGWYRFGPGFTARSGSIVVAGHVDSADQGKGAFFGLSKLAPGEKLTLTGPAGKNRDFTVVARERYRKSRIPLEKYFARDGAARLTLITCGGPFDSGTGHYRDNVVVTAEPVA
jgi:sortase family protein